MMKRRDFVRFSAAGVLAAPFLKTSAFAAGFPEKPVRWLVGYPPAGTTDILARLVGHALTEKFGQQFIIENKPGAGNNIATEFVINSPPDGYTVYLVNPANGINASLYKKLSFNFVRDMAPVGGITRVPNVMAVHPSVPAKTVAGVHRPLQGQSRQGQPGVVRQRHLGASVRRIVHGDDRREDDARAVSRLQPGADRHDRAARCR